MSRPDSWLGAVGVPDPPQPPRRAGPQPTASVLTCPACGYADQIQIRTSTGRCKHLLCQACNHRWKEHRDLARVLILR